MKRIVLLVCVVTLLTACGTYPQPKTTPAGKIVSAHQVPTSWNESPKMEIATSDGFVFIVLGNHYVHIGDNVEIADFPQGVVHSAETCLRVVGSGGTPADDTSCWEISK